MAFQKMITFMLFVTIALVSNVHGKPSFPHVDFPVAPSHIDFAPPAFGPQHLHAPTAFAAPAPLFPAPAPLVPAPVHFAPAPVSFAAAPLPLHVHSVPAPVAPVVHAPVSLPVAAPIAKVIPPVFEPVSFVAPSYRAIPGPSTTTHHVSVGYAFPQFAKLTHHHHHSLF